MPVVCSAIFQISANIIIQWFSSAATPRNLFNKEQMAKSVENSFLQFLQKVWQFLWKAGAASCWNLKCVFLSFPLIGHSCQKHFLHTAWFMSCVSMDTSDESGPFQPPPPPTVQKEYNFLSPTVQKVYIFCTLLCTFVQTASSLSAPRLGFPYKRNEGAPLKIIIIALRIGFIWCVGHKEPSQVLNVRALFRPSEARMVKVRMLSGRARQPVRQKVRTNTKQQQLIWRQEKKGYVRCTHYSLQTWRRPIQSFVSRLSCLDSTFFIEDTYQMKLYLGWKRGGMLNPN